MLWRGSFPDLRVVDNKDEDGSWCALFSMEPRTGRLASCLRVDFVLEAVLAYVSSTSFAVLEAIYLDVTYLTGGLTFLVVVILSVGLKALCFDDNNFDTKVFFSVDPGVALLLPGDLAVTGDLPIAGDLPDPGDLPVPGDR